MEGTKKEGFHVPYKIGLLSTHGTGKTALAHALVGAFKKRGYKTKVISEVATSLSEKGVPINENTTLPAQLSILMEQIFEELWGTIKEYDIIITDRSVFDNFVYLQRKFGNDEGILQFIQWYSEKFPYSQLYKLPLMGALQKDGIRSMNEDFQKGVYQHLTDFLNHHKIKHIELPTPKTEFREEWIDIIVKNTIDDLGKMGIFRYFSLP